MDVVYEQAFFDIQLRFAHTVATVSGLPLARALLEYTNLYIRFGLGRDFDPDHPVWRQYLAGLAGAGDAGEWTYAFYLARSGVTGAPPVVATFGCFSYALNGDRLRLHFQNVERAGCSPLALARAGQRVAELTALFEHVGRSPRPPLRVVGGSWLYNLDAYRRLFPPSYVATAHARAHRFQHMPLWGRFLDRHGATREHMTRPFLERLERESSLANLSQCFPFQALSLEAPVQAFHDFYGITPRPGAPAS